LYVSKYKGFQLIQRCARYCHNESCMKEGDPVELVTLKQYAEEHKISYEAVRKQVIRYAEELSDHIIKQDRTQYLDPWAVEFLTNRRRESPIVLMNMDQSEENERLKEEVESLRVKLMTAQNELLKEKDRIIELQDEAKKTLEDRARYTALLEESKAKDEKLKEAEDQIRTIQTERESDQLTIETIRKEADDLRKKSEEDQKKIEDLQKERDEAQTEAQSFTRSIFGFYRKR